MDEGCRSSVMFVKYLFQNLNCLLPWQIVPFRNHIIHEGTRKHSSNRNQEIVFVEVRCTLPDSRYEQENSAKQENACDFQESALHVVPPCFRKSFPGMIRHGASHGCVP